MTRDSVGDGAARRGKKDKRRPNDKDAAATAASAATTSSSSLSVSLAEKQNATMTMERSFLTLLAEACLSGDGTAAFELIVKYCRDNNNDNTDSDVVSPLDVLEQFRDGSGRTALHFACLGPGRGHGHSGEKKDMEEEEDIVPFLLLTSGLLSDKSHAKNASKSSSSSAAAAALCSISDTEGGMTPLMLAARHADPHTAYVRVDAILRACRPPTKTDAATNAPTPTTKTHTTTTATNAVEKVASIRSHDGATALHYACAAPCPSSLGDDGDESHSRADVVRLLLRAYPHASSVRSHKAGTPLHWACGVPPPENRTEVMEVLISEGGADVDAGDAANDDDDDDDDDDGDLGSGQVHGNKQSEGQGRGITPLFAAAAAGNDAHAKLLIAHGANRHYLLNPEGIKTQATPTTLDDGGKNGFTTVYHVAADLNLVGTLASLLEADAKDMNNDENDDDVAATKAKMNMCLTMKDGQGKIPLDLASEEGHMGCVMLLLPPGHNTENDAKALIEQKQEEMKQKEEERLLKEEEEEKEEQKRGGGNKKGKGSGSDLNQGNDNDNHDEDIASIEANASRQVLQIQQSLHINAISLENKSRAQTIKNEGNTYFIKKRWSDACNCYNECIKLNPADATYYSNRSACYLELGQYHDALHDAVLARHLNPTWVKGAYRLSRARLALGRFEDAAVAAWEGLRLDPNNDEMKSLLQKCVKLGRKEHEGGGNCVDNNNKNNKK